VYFFRRCIISIFLFFIIWCGTESKSLLGASYEQDLLPISTHPVNSRLAVSADISAESSVARIYYGTSENLEWLRSELDIWEEAVLDKLYVTALLSPIQMDLVKRAGYWIEIDEEQTLLHQQITDAAGMANVAGPENIAEVETIPYFACYRTVEETYIDLAELAVNYPQLAAWVDIGDSYDKITADGPVGYDLYALQLTNQAIVGPKPKLVILAAIHAREYVTAETATRFAEHLVGQYGHDPDVTWLLDYFEIHILPQANPDGRKIAEAGISWRKNRNPSYGCEAGNYGVDLNRNSSFRWSEGSPGSNTSDDSCSMTYRGPSPASEPEVQAIQRYITAVFPDQRGPLITDAAPDDTMGVFISIHSFAELVLPAWAWTADPAPNREGLMTLGSKFGYFNRYPVCDDCFGIADGTTDDWTYGEFGVASYTFELGRSFFEPCSNFEEIIYPDNLPALLYAAKAARRPYQNPAGPDVVQFMVNGSLVVTGTQIIEGQAITVSVLVDDSRHDNNLPRNPPSQNIQAARYSIDTPSWISPTLVRMFPASGTTTFTATPTTVMSTTILTTTPIVTPIVTPTVIPMATPTVTPMATPTAITPTAILTAVIDTSSLGVGRHLLFVEGQDSDGSWGVPSAIFLDVIAETPLAVLGDVNCDGVISIVDALFILQMDIGRRGRGQECPMDPNAPAYAPACDVNGDGSCGSVDALFLLQCDLGRQNNFCPP